MNTSISLPTPCEFVNITPINPLISKCQIKVCWVGQQPNRNKSVITKEVATDLANSLPGSPIVGFYNEETQDFEGHERAISIKDGKFMLKDITRPYGFVDLNAKVWFQWYLDSDGITREYLVTEGWLWTGQYPECQRIIDKGNNQSMELDDKLIDATWSKDENGNKKFFIINEGIISKLCILGENTEPCFEGAQITNPVNVQFSFEDGFKNQLFSLMEEMKKILNEGGTFTMEDNQTPVIEEEVVEEPVAAEEPVNEEPVVAEEEPATEEPVVEEPAAEPVVEESAPTFAKDEEKDDEEEEKCPECGKPISECTCEDKKEKYSLEEIPEYIELQNKYNELETNYSAVCAERDSLVEFKKSIEKSKKQDMINSFYMLSDEDKKDVIDNIDTYSLDDIEAKLSIICVRNRVSFEIEDGKNDEPVVYDLNNASGLDDQVPAWIKAVKANGK